jgi:hypothetical protein
MDEFQSGRRDRCFCAECKQQSLDLRGRDSCADDHGRRSPPLVFGRCSCYAAALTFHSRRDGMGLPLVGVGRATNFKRGAPTDGELSCWARGDLLRAAMRQFAKRSSSSLHAPLTSVFAASALDFHPPRHAACFIARRRVEMKRGN